MGQSTSSKQDNKDDNKKGEQKSFPPPPQRVWTTEFFVGLFAICGVLAVGYLSIGLGGLELDSSDKYELLAEFDNISGLQSGAPVEIAGVPIGEVASVSLADPAALVKLKVFNSIKIKDDDIASIRTKGIIGDKFIQISRGGSDIYLEPGETIMETESVMDLESLIGKFVHSMDSDDEE